MEGQDQMSKKLEAAVRGIVTRVILKYQPSSNGLLTPTLGSCESDQGPRRVEHFKLTVNWLFLLIKSFLFLVSCIFNVLLYF